VLCVFMGCVFEVVFVCGVGLISGGGQVCGGLSCVMGVCVCLIHW